VIFFSAEVDAFAAPSFALMMSNTSIVTIAIYTASKLPKLWSEVSAAIFGITIVVVPVVAVKLYIAVKAVTV
jgi:hypothetical protein